MSSVVGRQFYYIKQGPIWLNSPNSVSNIDALDLRGRTVWLFRGMLTNRSKIPNSLRNSHISVVLQYTVLSFAPSEGATMTGIAAFELVHAALPYAGDRGGK